MRSELKELYKYRELLYMITYRDIKIRYKQSIMGFLWALLMPILIVGSGVVIRYAYAVASGRPLQTADIASVAVKSLPWAFLSSSIRFSCTSLINNQNLVTKVYFPKEVFPTSAVMASLFDFFVAAGALLLFLGIVRVGWSYQLIWVPVSASYDYMFDIGNCINHISRKFVFSRCQILNRSRGDIRNFFHTRFI